LNLAVGSAFVYIAVEMESCWLELAIIFVLILANGFFAASEYALISSRRSRIAGLVEKGSRRAKLLKQLKSNPDSFIAAIQVGITLVGTLASVVGGATIVDSLTVTVDEAFASISSQAAHTISIGIVVVSIAFLTLVLGELVPKRLGLQHAERIALSVSRFIYVFIRLAIIPVRVLTFCTQLVLRLLKQDKVPSHSAITEDEIVQIIADGQKSGDFSQTEKEMVASIFKFADRTVHHAMTPRTDISAINIGWSTDESLRFITEEGFSRYPVYKDSVDNVIGLVYTRDIINILQNADLIILHDLLRKPFFVPDSKKLSEMLKDFQRRQMHMAIVLDEFGGTAGIITLEDIIEEIVGEIQDEYDSEEIEYRILGDGSLIVSSRMDVSEFNKLLGTSLPEDLADTIGGFIYTYLGKIPRVNQTIEYEDVSFTVTEKTGHRIDRLKVVKKE